MSIFDEVESEVRSYCRSFPAVFDKAQGSVLFDKNGNKYIDFFAGAGALNLGHNHPYVVKEASEYLLSGGVMHALDMHTVAKEQFLKTFKTSILEKKGLDHKVMFCGPTGTNAVEAALKLARKVTGRNTIFAFTGSFHGMTEGSLSVTSSRMPRYNLSGNAHSVVFMPYPYGFNLSFDTIAYIRNVLEDDHSGVELPAAMIVETVQAEGGVVVAPKEWLVELEKLCREFGILLIVDDIQVGCWRTGNFFSFERAGLNPDMIVLSKSISGMGFPMSLLLIKPEYDVWRPGEHNGTFRGNQLAIVTATAALKLAEDISISAQVAEKEKLIEDFIYSEIIPLSPEIEHRGIGMIHGIDFSRLRAETCAKVSAECFKRGLIIESAGRKRSVLKILPPLTIEKNDLICGLTIIKEAVQSILNA